MWHKTVRNLRVAGNVLNPRLSSQQPHERGRTFIKKLLLCRQHVYINEPRAQQLRTKDQIKQVA